ncbi:acyl carrier protein [Geothrix campi]|jgi:acyl carrier protein|uniref:acyl carrier protein n=1 Tax=Geothrix campi TaxID=2966450 RepID=UPI00214806CE|nr:acyl carrier protein [Geothrix sp. SG10]
MIADLASITPDLREFISRNFLFSDEGFLYGDAASFLQEGIIDSLGVMELVTYVEKQYGISVADDELLPSNFDSVSQLSAYITSKLEARV